MLLRIAEDAGIAWEMACRSLRVAVLLGADLGWRMAELRVAMHCILHDTGSNPGNTSGMLAADVRLVPPTAYTGGWVDGQSAP